MTDPLPLLHTRIRENAAKYFPQLGGRPVNLRCAPLRAGEGLATKYRFELRSESDATPAAELIVKLNPPNKPQFIEFDHLKLLFENRTSALLVPRPLDFFPDINALLTERVGGEQLSRLVLRRLHIFARHRDREWIASRIRLSGQWLAHYHRLTRRSPAAPFDREWLRRVGPTLDELERIGFSRLALAGIRSIFGRLHDFGQRHLAPYAERHGDFGLHNVHATDDWVCAFDFNDRRPECVYDDASLVGVTLETMSHWPRYPLFHRRAAIAMKEDFVGGYFGSSRECSHVLLEGHALKHLLRHCVRQRQKIARRTRALLPVFDAFRLKGFYRKRVLSQCGLLDGLLRLASSC